MFTDDELIPLSALQHFVFCRRQCALIHVERTWTENRLTAEGRFLHENADSGRGESRGDLRITRALPLRSLDLGLSGRADVVEFHRLKEPVPDQTAGVVLERAEGLWRPRPVEYKRGRPKEGNCDRVQLCAQALCLEEMLSVEIPEGSLYYQRTKRREDVVFDTRLREQTVAVAADVRRLLVEGRTPPARWEPKCSRCSLVEVCLPNASESSARRYLEGVLEPGPDTNL